jgi:KUP system potassium uptake protein
VLGVLSLILWSLIVVVTIKYVLLLLRADNNGEGGTLSLMALGQRALGRRSWLLLALGVIGGSMFLGDAMITPAISVLSAVEGLKIAAPALEHVVVPVAIVILICLFAVQSRGTAMVASAFGPVMIVWFLTLGIMGLMHISDDPGIVHAINPVFAVQFLLTHGVIGLVILGSVFLAVTGGEALYADLGHFGRKPIQMAWFYFVLPCLLLNYFGQGALVLSHPEIDRESILSHGAREGTRTADLSCDGCNRDREPGSHHRRVLAGAAGDPARSAAAIRGPLHF